MASKIEIVNNALVTLGETTINSLSEDTTAAKVANVKWDFSRRFCLRLQPWAFATERKELAQENTTPAFQFEYQYLLPADCVRLIQVYQDLDYRLERNRILTNRETCRIKYVKDETNTGMWDPLFTEMVAAKLAYELAYTIPRMNSLIGTMYELYEEKYLLARVANSQEDYSDKLGQHTMRSVSARFED